MFVSHYAHPHRLDAAVACLKVARLDRSDDVLLDTFGERAVW